MSLRIPETISFAPQSGFCPGCGHGMAVHLIAEVMRDMDLEEKLLTVVDVACGSLNIDNWHFDTIMAAHGRPIPTAVGVKHTRPNNPVMAYIGDGAAYSIGIAETLHSALRNDNITVVVVNNGIYGMTGGQMAPTTLPGTKTTSSPKGKDHSKYGTINITHMLKSMDIAYHARGAMVDVPNMRKAQKYLKKAFEKQMNNEGFSLVELLSPCPTNYHMTPLQSKQYVKDNMRDFFEVGEFIERGVIE